MIDTKPIETRYSALAESSCCLSCGGAIDYAKPRLRGDLPRSRKRARHRCAAYGRGGGQNGLRLRAGRGAGHAPEGARDGPAAGRHPREVPGIPPGTRPPLPHHHVNLVISNCTLNHASDKMAVWSEIHGSWSTAAASSSAISTRPRPVPAQYANDPEAVAECWAGAVTREAYLETLEACGFQNVRIIEESAPYDKGKIQVSSFTVQGEKPKKPAAARADAPRGPNGGI